MKSKYTIGSKIHQALCKIEMLPMDAGTWRKSVQYKDAPSIFDRAIIQPLSNDGFINRSSYNFTITPSGISRLDQMGRFAKWRRGFRLQKQLPNREAKYTYELYTGKETRLPAVRSGADDHFAYPSRRFDGLFYRDGSIRTL
jgi:hypothetical protein